FMVAGPMPLEGGAVLAGGGLDEGPARRSGRRRIAAQGVRHRRRHLGDASLSPLDSLRGRAQLGEERERSRLTTLARLGERREILESVEQLSRRESDRRDGRRDVVREPAGREALREEVARTPDDLALAPHLRELRLKASVSPELGVQLAPLRTDD